MRNYRTTYGPFTERPFYTLKDVENICNDELRKVGLLPSAPEPIRIERFIEKRFKIHPTYKELPDGVLGYTEFGPDGVMGITVSKILSEEDSKVSERRINTTLAHEAGHGLLHAHLFMLGQKPESLFGKHIDSNKPKILCRSDSVQGIQGFKETGYRWWEYQANLAIGSLLLPRNLVMISLDSFFTKKGSLGLRIFDESRQEDAIDLLSQIFDVNPIVAKIRTETLFKQHNSGEQLTL